MKSESGKEITLPNPPPRAVKTSTSAQYVESEVKRGFAPYLRKPMRVKRATTKAGKPIEENE